MIEGLLYQKLVSGMSTPTVTERLVNSILLEGHLRKQMEQLLDRLATAQERVCRRLESIGFEIFCEPRAGMFVWARPAGWEGDAGELATPALGERIVLAPGMLFYGGDVTANWMRFNVAHSHFDQLYVFLKKAIERTGTDRSNWSLRPFRKAPDMRGFSPRNLKYMRALAQAWPDQEFVQQPAAQLPWFHLRTLLDKVNDSVQRDWFATRALEHGRSRAILIAQVQTDARGRAGNAVTNFAERLPPPQSDLAREALKDPYIYDFLALTEDAQERDIERALPPHITQFLLELGAGFAFVGRQYRLEVGGDEFSSICFSITSSCVAMSALGDVTIPWRRRNHKQPQIRPRAWHIRCKG